MSSTPSSLDQQILDLAGEKMYLPPTLYAHELATVYNPRLYQQLPTTVIIATTTAYKSEKDGKLAPDTKLRADLAIQTFQKATQRGYTVVDVDAKSDAGWVKHVKDLGVIVIDEKLDAYPGEHFMGRSRRQALDTAANHSVQSIIHWMEPEKHTWIDNDDGHLSPLASSASIVYEGKADIAIGRRIDNLQSYPLQQQFSEILGNLTVMKLLQEYFSKIKGTPQPSQYYDFWVGPRAISRKTIDYFLQYQGDFNGTKLDDRWGSIFVPIWQAMADGKTVGALPVNYVHPPEQTKLEAAQAEYYHKRIVQLECLTETCRNFTQVYIPTKEKG